MKRKRKIQGKGSSLGYTTSHKKRKFRKAAVAITILTAVAVFVISPYSRYALSLSVMSVYSKICEQESILKEKGMELEIPGGCEAEEPDWYPFVMTFNPIQSHRKLPGRKGRQADDPIQFSCIRPAMEKRVQPSV